MIALREVKQMSVHEKLRLMETLWDELSEAEEELSSPAWHGELLEERDRMIANGTDQFIDWDVAKMQLRSELK